MTTRPRHAVVRAAAAAGLAGAALLLSACSATNPITTMNNYEASDGLQIDLGDVRLGNVLVLSAGEGEPGYVVGSVTNDGDHTEVSIELDGTELVSLDLRAGETVLMGGEDGEEVEVESVEAPAGGFVDLTVRSGSGSTTRPVPVLDGTLPEYRDYAPAPERTSEPQGEQEETTESGDQGADGDEEN